MKRWQTRLTGLPAGWWRRITWVRSRPGRDLAAVLLSWLLLVAVLSTATFLVTPERGFPYFLVFNVVGIRGR